MKRFDKSEVVELLQAFGHKMADQFSPARLEKIVGQLEDEIEENDRPKGLTKQQKRLLDELLEAVADDEELDFESPEDEDEDEDEEDDEDQDEEDEDEEDERPSKKSAKKKSKPASKKSSDEDDEDEEEEDEEGDESDEDEEDDDEAESEDEEDESDDNEQTINLLTRIAVAVESLAKSKPQNNGRAPAKPATSAKKPAPAKAKKPTGKTKK